MALGSKPLADQDDHVGSKVPPHPALLVKDLNRVAFWLRSLQVLLGGTVYTTVFDYL